MGEFQHEIMGEVLIPEVMAEFKITDQIFVNQKFTQEFNFSSRNEQLQNALKIHESRLSQANKQKEKEELQQKRNNM